MSGEISLRRTSTAPARATALDVGATSDVSAATFGPDALLYESAVPRMFRRGAAASTDLVLSHERAAGVLTVRATPLSPRSEREVDRITAEAIASGVKQLPGVRRSGDRKVQRRLAWQATPSRVVISTIERDLEPVEGSAIRMRPSKSGWLLEERVTYPCVGGAAQRRVGTVPFESGPGLSAAGGAASDPTQAAVRNAFPDGAESLSYLPTAVRASAITRVPTPTVFDGALLQFTSTETGKVVRTQVDLIRMDATTAVVIQARAPHGATAWEVTQATYALGTPEVERA